MTVPPGVDRVERPSPPRLLHRERLERQLFAVGHEAVVPWHHGVTQPGDVGLLPDDHAPPDAFPLGDPGGEIKESRRRQEHEPGGHDGAPAPSLVADAEGHAGQQEHADESQEKDVHEPPGERADHPWGRRPPSGWEGRTVDRADYNAGHRESAEVSFVPSPVQS